MSGAVPSPAARPSERAARVPRPVCPGCGRCGRVDPAPAPQRARLRAGVARCGGGGRASPGGVPSTVVRWPGVRRCPSPGRSSSGACSQGSATRVSRARSMRACGPSTGPTACALAGRRCSLWGWRKGVPGGGAFHRCEGRLVSGAVPPPAARPPERAARVPRPVCPGCGRCGRVDPAPAPQRAPLRAGVARCGGGGRASPGGAAFHRCERRLVPGAVPPPAARPPERAAGVPRPACPGRGRCGRGDPAPAPQRAPLRAGVARCGGGGRASPGGGAFHHCEGRLGSGAVPLRSARPLLGGLPGFVGCVRCVWCLCRACRGAWCCSSLGPPLLPSPVSRCGVVLAVCPPCPLPCVRPLLVRWLPLVPFAASLLFTLSSIPLPGMHFFPASALLCVSVFFLVGPGFLL